MELSPIAEKIFKMKYSVNGEETWDQACLRVASYIAKGDLDLTGKYFQLINELVFLPGGRILANAGTDIKNLNNCFVLPIEDSRQSIYNTLKNAAEIFAWGGGLGYNFSNVREEGAPIKTTGGKASGPLSFMSLFDQTGEVIQQASRRGAQMGMLDIDHFDIEKFINFKSSPNTRNARLMEEYKRNLITNGLDKKGTKYFQILEKTLTDDQLTHFNISVVITDEFMEAVKEGVMWELKSRVDDMSKWVDARELMNSIAERAWESGDPGIFFYNRTNEDNMVPFLGNLRVTNPCGEIPLLPYEPCCLGSINLHKFYDADTNSINLPFLEYTVRTGIRFLDSVQDLTLTPVSEVNTWSRGLRRLGLGVMGWADLLAELGIPYDSEDAIQLANYLSWFISFFSWLESIELAKENGPFPFYDAERVNLDVVERVLNSEFNPHRFDMEEIRKIGLRNVSVTGIAPTGTIALIAGVNSSIEPFFALSYKRNITEGVGNTAKDYVIEYNPILKRKLEQIPDADKKKIEVSIKKSGELGEIPENFKKLFCGFSTSHKVEWNFHVGMQAAWQNYTTNSVSKTINMPNSSSQEDILKAYFYAWQLGCKGITVYRDGSKLFQILNK